MFSCANCKGIPGSISCIQCLAYQKADHEAKLKLSPKKVVVSIYETTTVQMFENFVNQNLYRRLGPVDAGSIAYEWIGG